MDIAFVGELLLLVCVGIIVYGIYIWSQFRQLRHLAQDDWSAVILQLKRRSDLIPAILTTISYFGNLQPSIIERINILRSQAPRTISPLEREQKENEIEEILRSIFYSVQNHPQLQESHDFINLSYTIGEIEEKLNTARNIYNETVHHYNMEVNFFPNNIIAQLFHLYPLSYFQEGRDQPGNIPDSQDEEISYASE